MKWGPLAWLRALIERCLGLWYEGVLVPRRLIVAIDDFEALNPKATAADWKRYALIAVPSAYREGFVRGYESDARAPGMPDPDAAADGLDPFWRDSPPFVVEVDPEPEALPVPAPSETEMQRLLRRARAGR